MIVADTLVLIMDLLFVMTKQQRAMTCATQKANADLQLNGLNLLRLKLLHSLFALWALFPLRDTQAAIDEVSTAYVIDCLFGVFSRETVWHVGFGNLAISNLSLENRRLLQGCACAHHQT